MGRFACVGLVALAACFSQPPAPPPPTTGGSAAALVAGTEHACTIDGSGALFCWGNNDYGRLGIPATTRYSAMPVRIDGMWSEVAVGSRHTCALDTDHAVWCWGRSDMGQAGMVAMTVDKTQVTLPDSSAIATHIYAGGDMSCATDRDGRLYCWGDFDPSASAPHDPTHVQPGAYDSWLEVAAAPSHACALDDMHRAWCWGLDDDIQVGDPTAAAHGIADAFHIADSTFRSIAAGQYASCGITTASTVACWGVGTVTTGGADTSGYTVVGSDTDWQSIVVGGAHACATHGNGDLDCWGDNSAGELGNDYVPKLAPGGAATLQRVSATAAGDLFTCAQDDQGIRCWGSDEYGQCGRGVSATLRVPAKVALPSTAVSVAAGLQFTCAALSTGAVYCWGQNDSAQGAPNGEFANASPVDSGHVVDTTPTNNRLLSLGVNHACGLASTTKIDCWGDNTLNQLSSSGIGVTISDLPAATGTTFVDFGAGGFGSCATTNMNELYCWGSTFDATTHDPQAAGSYRIVSLDYDHVLAASSANDIIQLGTTTFCNSAGGTLVGSSGTTQQRQVYLAQGGKHGCALDNDGAATTTLVCWGTNSNHQVSPSNADCIAPPTAWPPPSAATVTIPNGVMWAQNRTRPQTVAVGGSHSCAIEEATSKLYCWGENTEAELGDLDAATDIVMQPHQATAGTWVEVTTGVSHTCALDTNGAVWCWGLNKLGEVGNGDRWPSNARIAKPVMF